MEWLTLAPLVDQQRWWFCVSRFYPGREEASLVGLVPQVLVQVGVCDLLQRFHIIHGDQVAVQVHKLNSHLERNPKYNDCLKKGFGIVQKQIVDIRKSGVILSRK